MQQTESNRQNHLQCAQQNAKWLRHLHVSKTPTNEFQHESS